MLAELVACVAAAAGRPDSDVKVCVEKLNSHWLTSLDDYAALGASQRRELQLPLFLRVQLDRIVSLSNQASSIESNSAATSCSSRAIMKSPHTTAGAVRAWLECRVKAPHPEELHSLLANARFDDFFLLPMLDDTALRILGISEKSLLESLAREIGRLRRLSPHQMVGEWARVQGCEREAALLEAQRVDTWVLRASKGTDLAEVLSLPISHPLIEAVPPLTHFSSVLESFIWLHSTGFGKYSFHFARYNIPFYALPYVNFFILEEMGVSHDDSELLVELQHLKADPLFGAKALAYWLRDLELERYIGSFAAESILSLDHLMQLATSGLPRSVNQTAPPLLTELVAPLNRVITAPSDRNKLLAGMQELNEFHWYYKATALLLQRIGFGRFVQLFTQYGISIDVISLLEDAHLAHMGIRSMSDRSALLSTIASVRQHLPHGLENITPVPEPSHSSGVVPQDTRPLDELLSYIDISLEESPKGGKGKKQKPKAAAKGAKTNKPSAAKGKSNKEKEKHSNSAPSSPVIPPAKDVPTIPEDDDEQLPPVARVAGGSGKRSANAPSLLPSAATQQQQQQQQQQLASSSPPPPAAATGKSRSALSQSDTGNSGNSGSSSSSVLSFEKKMAALLRASGGTSPDPCDPEIDPAKQAQVDDEVEQFRRRLEAAALTSGRTRVKIFAL